jgi:hypothetical protein
MSEKKQFENLTGPLKPSENYVDGIGGLGEGPPETASPSIHEGGTSTAKSGVETMDAYAESHSPKSSGIARRSASHPIENSSSHN